MDTAVLQVLHITDLGHPHRRIIAPVGDVTGGNPTCGDEVSAQIQIVALLFHHHYRAIHAGADGGPGVSIPEGDVGDRHTAPIAVVGSIKDAADVQYPILGYNTLHGLAVANKSLTEGMPRRPIPPGNVRCSTDGVAAAVAGLAEHAAHIDIRPVRGHSLSIPVYPATQRGPAAAVPLGYPGGAGHRIP